MVVPVFVHVELGVGVEDAGVPCPRVADGAVLGAVAEVGSGGAVDFQLAEGGVSVALQDVSVAVADGVDVVEVVLVVKAHIRRDFVVARGVFPARLLGFRAAGGVRFVRKTRRPPGAVFLARGGVARARVFRGLCEGQCHLTGCTIAAKSKRLKEKKRLLLPASGGLAGGGGGVGGVVGGLEAFDGDPGVEGGGVGLGVAEELLDEAAVGPALEHVRGGGVAEEVATAGAVDPGGEEAFLDPVAEVAGGDALAVAAEEEGLFGGVVVEEGAALQEVAVEPGEGGAADGDEAFLLPLAVADVEGAARRVEVGEVEEAEFPPPRAGGVEGFEEGAVADAERVGDVGDGEEGGELFAGESPGEPAGRDAGKLEVGGGVGGEAALADEPGEEALEGGEALFLRGGAEGEAAGPPEAGEVALVGLEAGAVDLPGAG